MIVTRHSKRVRGFPTVHITDATSAREWQAERQWENIRSRAPAELKLRIRKAMADADRTGYGCYVDPRDPRVLHEIRRVHLAPFLACQFTIPLDTVH